MALLDISAPFEETRLGQEVERRKIEALVSLLESLFAEGAISKEQFDRRIGKLNGNS